MLSGEWQWGPSGSPRVQTSDTGSLWPAPAAHPVGTCQPEHPADVSTFVAIAFETDFREINHRLKYFKEYISLLFLHSYYITILLSFLLGLFFVCIVKLKVSYVYVQRNPDLHTFHQKESLSFSWWKDSLIAQERMQPSLIVGSPGNTLWVTGILTCQDLCYQWLNGCPTRFRWNHEIAVSNTV